MNEFLTPEEIRFIESRRNWDDFDAVGFIAIIERLTMVVYRERGNKCGNCDDCAERRVAFVANLKAIVEDYDNAEKIQKVCEEGEGKRP